MTRYATAYNPRTGERKRVVAGDPNAFRGGFVLSSTPRQPQTYTDFLNQAFKNPEYQRANQAVTAAETDLGNLASQEPGFLQREQSRLQQADPQLQSLLGQKATAAGQLYSQPFTAQDQFRDIFDPLVREKLIAQSVGNVLGQVTGLQDLITQRQGTARDQAQTALDYLKSNISGAESRLKSTQDTRDSLQKLLMNIAEKGYESVTKEKERKQKITDALDTYMKKLAVDQKLGINDFRPRSTSSTLPSQGKDVLYDAQGNQVGYAWSNPKTAQTVYQDFNGNPIPFPPGGRVGGVSFQPQQDISPESIVENIYRMNVGE